MVENIKKALDAGKIVCAVLMDLSKAFDCLPHKLLLSKFKAYGMSPSACRLLSSYLKEWQHVSKGAAQGSIMGPFCFNVFTNDLRNTFDDKVEIYNYADDNTLISTGYNYEDVHKVISWFEDNHMAVNPIIVFGNVAKPGTFTIKGNALLPTDNVKLLGLQICEKAGRQVQVLSRLNRVLNKSSKLLLYNSFIECYFAYCCVIWHFCGNAGTIKVDRIQEKALRHCTLDFSSSYTQLLRACDKSTLYTTRLRKITELAYRILNEIYPTYLSDFIQLKECRDLRAIIRLSLPKVNTVKHGKASLLHLTPMLWNSLNNDVKTSNTLSLFKHRVKVGSARHAHVASVCNAQ